MQKNSYPILRNSCQRINMKLDPFKVNMEEAKKNIMVFRTLGTIIIIADHRYCDNH